MVAQQQHGAGVMRRPPRNLQMYKGAMVLMPDRSMARSPRDDGGDTPVYALGTYTEFPFDLVTDVHFKKKSKPPPGPDPGQPCGSPGDQGPCGMYGWTSWYAPAIQNGHTTPSTRWTSAWIDELGFGYGVFSPQGFGLWTLANGVVHDYTVQNPDGTTTTGDFRTLLWSPSSLDYLWACPSGWVVSCHKGDPTDPRNFPFGCRVWRDVDPMTFDMCDTPGSVTTGTVGSGFSVHIEPQHLAIIDADGNVTDPGEQYPPMFQFFAMDIPGVTCGPSAFIAMTVQAICTEETVGLKPPQPASPMPWQPQLIGITGPYP